MKTANRIFEQIADPHNLLTAMHSAAKGKTNRTAVKRILKDDWANAVKISQLLNAGKFVPAQPKKFIINDGSNLKTRTITKPVFFPDQIIHWSLITAIEKLFMRGMYAYSCGSVPKRGTSLGQKMIRKWLDNDPKNTRYCLKMDITKFYPNIDNELLKAKFRTIIRDARVLKIIDDIIDSQEGQAIGYYTSQWFANFFLQDLDHKIKQEFGTERTNRKTGKATHIGVKYYVRYVDDLVIFGSNKRYLHTVERQIIEYLKTQNLQISRKRQVFPVESRAVDVLGLRFFKDKTILRKRNSLRIRRRMRKISKKEKLSVHDATAVVSYYGWVKHSDSFNFYKNVIKPVVPVGKAKGIIRYDLRKNRSN